MLQKNRVGRQADMSSNSDSAPPQLCDLGPLPSSADPQLLHWVHTISEGSCEDEAVIYSEFLVCSVCLVKYR